MFAAVVAAVPVVAELMENQVAFLAVVPDDVVFAYLVYLAVLAVVVVVAMALVVNLR